MYQATRYFPFLNEAIGVLGEKKRGPKVLVLVTAEYCGLVMGLMAEDESASPTSSAPPSYALLLRIMSKRRTWVCLFIFVYAILLSSTWNFIKYILSWYKLQSEAYDASGWPALYASVLLGVVFGVLSMVAALAVAVPATMVTWITVVVLLAFFGKPRKVLVVEGRKITKEIVGFVCKILLKEGNLVAVVCAVLGYFFLVRRNNLETE